MMTPLRALQAAGIAIFAFISGAAPLFAGSYGPQAFTYNNGTTNLGDGTTIASSPSGVASIQDNSLRLLENGTGNTSSSFKLPDLDPGKEVMAFTVTYKLRMSGGSPADGYTLNFGNIPSGNGGGEQGFQMQNGLAIAWDTYNNGDDPRSIEVFANGVSVGNFVQNFQFDSTFRNVVIHWDENGLDITYDGQEVCTNLPTPGFRPAPGNRFAFSGRTGGSSMELRIDDLQISTSPTVPIETGGLIISEFVAANDNSYEDDDGDSSDWIEIYNGQNANVNLGGWTLTNDPANKTKWTFPAKTLGPYQYLVVFASEKNRTNATYQLHTNFKLAKEGGYVALMKPGGTEVASEYTYGEQVDDVSYGETGISRTVGYIQPPTPLDRNSATVADGPPAEEVVYSHEGGLITDSLSLSIATPEAPGAVVRYTLDNSAPNTASPVYVDPFNVDQNFTIRARVYAPGRLPGPIKSRTFIRLHPLLTNYNGSGSIFSSHLPVLVLDSYGFNVDSVSNPGAARPHRLTYAVLIDRDPTLPAPNTNRALLTGKVDFQGRCGTHVRGESSSNFPQKSYAWELWDEHNEDKPASLLGMPEESDWVLHGPFTDKTLMRNYTVYDAIRAVGGNGAGMRTRFVEVFFKQDSSTLLTPSHYRGVYVLVEKIKRDSERVDIEELTELSTRPEQITGGYIFKHDKPSVGNSSFNTNSGVSIQGADPEVWNTQQRQYLQTYLNQFEVSLNGPSFGYTSFIDVDSFIDNQWWVEITKQIDGYRISTYFTKSRHGKIRALPIWDYNLSLSNANYLEGDQPEGWYYTQLGSGDYYWYPKLHQDANYRTRHWDRYWEHRKGVWNTDSILARIDGYAAELLNGDTTPVTNNMSPRPPLLENAVMRHYRKYQILGKYEWPNAAGWDHRIYYNSNGNPTTGEVDFMKDWLVKRLLWIDDQNRVGSVIYRPPVFSHEGGSVPNGTQLTITPYSGTPPNGTSYATGTIYYTLDGSDPRAAGGGLSGSAIAYAGPIAMSGVVQVKARLRNGSNWSPITTATFAVGGVPASSSNLVITEVNYHPLDPSPAEISAGHDSENHFEWIELMNVSDQTVDLSAVRIVDGVTFDFANAKPGTAALGPGERVVIVGKEAAFLMRYGPASIKIAGTFDGNLSNQGERIVVLGENDAVIADFSWDDAEPWPEAADGDGYTLVLNNPAGDIDYSDPRNWRPSATVGGTPGGSNSTTFTGDPSDDTDKDGHSDFLEYATGTSPTDPAQRATPVAEIVNYNVGSDSLPFLRFSYIRNLAADGVTYTVEVSNNAVDWMSGPDVVVYESTVHNGDGTATVTYRSAMPITEETSLFMRLRVSP